MQFNSRTKQVKLIGAERRALQRALDACQFMARVFDDSRGEAAKSAVASLTTILTYAEEPSVDERLAAVG